MDKKYPVLRILHTPPRFYPDIGGVENQCLDLCSGQMKAGIQVQVVCASRDWGRNLVKQRGIPVRGLRSWFRIAGTNITPMLPLVLTRERYDVLQTYLPTPWSADWSVLIAKVKRKPVVLTYCNDIVGDGLYSFVAKLYNATVLRLVLALVDQIVLTSGEGNRGRSALLLPHRTKTVLIPPGIDVDHFVPIPQLRQPDTVFFLAVLDEFHRYKGLHDLIRAMPLIHREFPRARLIVGGEGALRTEYEILAANLGVANNIEFVGSIPERDLVATYNRASVFVLPSTDSRQEGFGMVLTEAMACAVPVVTTSAVGMASAITESQSGLVVAPGAVEELAQAIRRTLRDQVLAERMGRNGRNLVTQRFSSASVSERYMEVYRDCLVR